MVYKGHAKDGVIHADEPVELPEGAVVRFEIAAAPDVPAQAKAPFAERFAEVMGKAQTLPEDASENHDHCLYGAPKE